MRLEKLNVQKISLKKKLKLSPLKSFSMPENISYHNRLYFELQTDICTVYVFAIIEEDLQETHEFLKNYESFTH